jgi:hypothetical protein
MARSFETDEAHSSRHLRPLRVATRPESVYDEAKTLVEDLPKWKLVQADDARQVLTCSREGGFLAGPSTVTIRVEGPEGIPSCTVHVRSESSGGLRSRDRANVVEFMEPFHRRVC